MRKNELDFTGLFGQCEMEEAAKRIVIVTGYCDETPVCQNDFRTDTERTGFKELIANAWLIPSRFGIGILDGVAYWTMVDEFWDRVNSRERLFNAKVFKSPRGNAKATKQAKHQRDNSRKG